MGAVVSAGRTGRPAEAGVPTGGTAGQVLLKNSAADNDLLWGDPLAGTLMGGAPPAVSGGWCSNTYSGVGTNTVVVPSGGTFCYPFWVETPTPISQIQVALSVAETGTMTCGISGHNAAMRGPGVILTSLSATAPAATVFSSSVSLTLPAGWLWAFFYTTGGQLDLLGSSGTANVNNADLPGVRAPLGAGGDMTTTYAWSYAQPPMSNPPAGWLTAASVLANVTRATVPHIWYKAV